MIDFRYHLVSIIAVFLALAIGIVVGSVAISPNAASLLSKESQNAVKRNAALFAQNALLKKQISADDAFAQAAETYLVRDLLIGQRVALVTAPGADAGTVSGISAALTRAGATVTGTVSLTSQFFGTDPTTEHQLTNSATLLAPSGVSTADTAGAQIPGQQAAAKVIAAAIMDKLGVPTLTTAQSNNILTGFGDQGFLQVSNGSGGTTLSSQATIAVVVLSATTSASASSLSPENLGLIYLTHYLQQAGKGAVLAGSLQGSGTGSAIDAVTSGGAGVALTTVDNADTHAGQIIVVQALRNMLNPHPPAAAAYGVGPGTVPSPVPTSSVTPTSTSTKVAKQQKKKTVKR